MHKLNQRNSSSFGEVMRTGVRESWIPYNLNYELLRNRLLEVKREFGLRKAISSRSLTGETRTFAELLDEQVEKIVLFYLKVQGEIASKVWILREKHILEFQDRLIKLDEIEKFSKLYRQVGNEVLELLEYLDLNVIGLRKILMKHDRQFDMRMSSMYFDTRLGTSGLKGNKDGNILSKIGGKNNEKNSQLLQLYHQEGLRAIIGSIRRGFEDLYDAKITVSGEIERGFHLKFHGGPSIGLGDLSSLEDTARKSFPRMSYQKRVQSYNQLKGLEEGKSTLSRDRNNSNPTPASRKRQTGIFGMLTFSSDVDKDEEVTKDIEEFEPVLKKINEASTRVMLSQKRTITEYIVTHSTIGLELTVRDMEKSDDDESDDEIGLREKKTDARETSNVGLFIALLMTFLYQANQYVVAPTSGQYADMLGQTQAMSGLIIGLSPFATIFSVILFSAWTNSSYKNPYIFCAFLLAFGNLIYASALQYNSIWMLFIGRMLTGAGAPRGIARRYIADHVSLKDRTAASNHFVTAGALGLAFGPLASSLLGARNVSYTYTILGIDFRYETVTAPGWLMFFLFGIALIVIIITFDDPLQLKIKSLTKNSLTSQLSRVFKRRNSSRSLLHGRENYGAVSSTEDLQQQVVGIDLVDLIPSSLDSTTPSDGKFSPINVPDPTLSTGNIQNIPTNDIRQTSFDSDEPRDMYRNYNRDMSFNNNTQVNEESSITCWKHISFEVGIILFIYVVNKIGQEIVVSSVPLLSSEMIGWNASQVGYYMAIMGFLVLPANIIVSRLSREVEDRNVMIYLNSISLGCISILMNVSLIRYSLFQYVLGSTSLFIFLNALEGIIMSLLSKLVSPELAKGTFNSGLLATEAGTIGRVVGDVIITWMGSSKGTTELVNLLFGPIGIGVILCGIIVNRYYDRLEV